LRKKNYDFEPRTIGDHLRKRRLKLGLTQKQVAGILKVTQFSIMNWERGDFQPNLPTVLHRVTSFFLGYDPDPPSVHTLADQLRAKRLS